MKIKIENATIVTINNQKPFIGEIVIEDDIISYVGKKYNKDIIFDRIINANGNIVMPGFINAHTHTAMSLLKNTSDDKNLQNWLELDILPREKNLTPEEIYWGTMLGISEYVKNGITTFCDAYYFPEYTLKAVEKSGIRASICLGYHPNDSRSKEELENEYLTLKNKYPNTHFFMYAHSIYTVDEAQFNTLISLAKKYSLPLYTHMSETLVEVSDCTVKYNGLTPTQLLLEYGFFDTNSTVAHSVYVEKEDIDILSQYEVNVVSNPASNLKLGSGIAPIIALDKLGVNVALGTDGASSNNALDMFREMYLVSTLQKAQMRDASVVNAKKTLEMATKNGAKALFYDKIGVLKEGNYADLIILDVHMPNLTPLNDAESAIVYSAGVQNVVLTMVNGKVLYENGRFFIGEEIETILENVNK